RRLGWRPRSRWKLRKPGRHPSGRCCTPAGCAGMEGCC
ncbi:hypothetical protein AK812_SmicGene48634, partial [Symbiodinium microadriaticum]